MKELVVKQFSDEEFVLIDDIEYKKEKIYHFGNFKGEIFCTKVNDDYIPITDKFKLNLIKNLYGIIDNRRIYSSRFFEPKRNNKDLALKILKNPKKYHVADLEELSRDECEKIIEEQLNNFQKLRERTDSDIDIDKIKSTFDTLRIFHSSSCLRKGEGGSYNQYDNYIMFYAEGHKKDDIKNKRIRFHEFIHSITNKKCLLYALSFNRGLLEGETDNIVELIFGKDEGLLVDTELNTGVTMRFPFSKDISYQYQVSLVRQMEFLLGEKSYKSVLDGNMDFEKKFSKKYGLPLTIFLAYRATRLTGGGKNFDSIKYFDETQNVLMQHIFDKKFENVETIDDAEEFFKRLDGLNAHRGKIDIGTRVAKDVYKDYFNEKIAAVKEKLVPKGFSEKEIDERIEKYKNFGELDEEINIIYGNDTPTYHPSMALLKSDRFLNSIISKGKKIVRTSKLELLARRIGNHFRREVQDNGNIENGKSKES